MSLNRISKIERIAILSQLVSKYCMDANIVEVVRLAKDLANVIDELNYLNVDLSELSHEFLNFFPEHWKKRTQFLLIVTKYWKQILKERDLADVEVSQWSRPTMSNPAQHSFDLFRKVSIFENQNIYDEIDLVIQIINECAEERISIISANQDFSRYLSMRLDAEGIKYISHCGGGITSQEVIENVNNHFNNCSKDELKRLVKELSDIVENDVTDGTKDSAKVFLLPPPEIYKIPRNEVTIYTELNENIWKPRDAGYFWLHYTLRKKLGLLRDTSFMENLFYYGIELSKKIYLLRAIKSEGRNNKKSSILAKFEAIAEKSGITLNFLPHRQEERLLENTQDPPTFRLPKELDAWDVELLSREPYAFFAKNILGLPKEEHDPKQKEIRKLFRQIVKIYFKDQKVEFFIEALKKIDFFAYHKALRLVEFLQKSSFDVHPSYNDVYGKMAIPEIDISISGTADRIIENGDCSTLICFRSSTSPSAKEIIYDGCSAMLSLCWMGENHGFSQNVKPIRNIQIWNLMARDEDKIVDKEIEISKEILDEFAKRLCTSLEPYLCDQPVEIDCNAEQKGLYNDGYEHFKRNLR